MAAGTPSIERGNSYSPVSQAAHSTRTHSGVVPRLLSINNFYYRRGGSEAVFLDHNQLFEQAGWQVLPFATRDPRNLATPWEQYFPRPQDFQSAQRIDQKLLTAGRLIYSYEARRCIRRLIQTVRPSIAHAHNIYHHLSPSVLSELQHQGVPTVMTLHDLKIACPAYKMFSGGAACERCRDGKLRNVIVRRCIKDSLAMSALVWLESTVHRLLDVYTKTVSRFVVPSRFFQSKLVEWGFDPARFVHIPNFVDTTSEPVSAGADGFAYIGRLVPEKGVGTLIRAAALAGVPLKIAGTGSEEAGLRILAERSGGDISFCGHLQSEEIRALVAGARAVVVPSEWYENAPLSLMEASAAGKAVIGARIGGIPELVRDGETGMLFESGDVESLADALRRVQSLPALQLREMGMAGFDWMRRDFTAEYYRERTLFLYRSLGVGP